MAENSQKPISKYGRAIKVEDKVRYLNNIEGWKYCTVTSIDPNNYISKPFAVYGRWAVKGGTPHAFDTHVSSLEVEHVELEVDKEYEDLLI